MANQIGCSWRIWLLPIVSVLQLSCTQSNGHTTENPTATEESEMSEISHIHHGIDYIEFVVTDMDESKRFYSAAFGWEFNDYGPEYAGIRKEGGEAGGLRLDSAASTGGPLVILYSNALNATLTRVRDAGGKITKEPFEFPGGRRFQFQDPTGNELAVWSEK